MAGKWEKDGDIKREDYSRGNKVALAEVVAVTRVIENFKVPNVRLQHSSRRIRALTRAPPSLRPTQLETFEVKVVPRMYLCELQQKAKV